MRLYPSTAERITLPLLTDEAAVEINGLSATLAMMQSGDRSGLHAPDGGPTFTVRPLSPRESNLAGLRAGVNAPRGAQARMQVAAHNTAHAAWLESGEGDEPVLDPEVVANFESWSQELAYAHVQAGLISIDGVPGCQGAPSGYIERLPWHAVIEIANAIRAASEVPPMGKASSGSPPRAPTPSTSSNGTASPASETGSVESAATAAAHSPALCSTDTPTASPTCLGAPSTMAPSSAATGAST